MVEAGASYREVAAHYGVSQSAVGKWMLRYRRTGSAAAKPAGGNRMSLLDKERDWISARLAAEPDLPPSQLHRSFAPAAFVSECQPLQDSLEGSRCEQGPREQYAPGRPLGQFSAGK
jgi:hypothetical protein